MSEWSRRKSFEALTDDSQERLKPTLSWWHLVALGVGAIVGTGIYTLVGVGANLAGPAVVLSAADVPAPAAVRYAWRNNPRECNLENAAGLPACAFRSDDWPLCTPK